MPPKEGSVWTMARKVTGNLLPLVLASPLLYFALVAYGESGPSVRLIEWIGAFVAAAWVFLAVFGLVGNSGMKNEMERRLHIERPFDKTEKYFVGFARPAFKSAVDPHEDLGFLLIHRDSLEFFGGSHRATLDKKDVTGVRLRPNTHSIVGLGRWVSVEAVVDDKPVRLLVEPRVKRTLLGNLFFSKRLAGRIRAWSEREEPRADAQGPSVASS